MAYTEHDIVKMQKIADLTVGLVAEDLTLAKAITHEGVEKFKGAEGDTLTFRVPGRLPARDYEWRTRNQPIEFDVYKMARTQITFGGRAYSAVELTDEQAEFDLDGWAKLVGLQAQAVGTKLNHKAASLISQAPYEFVVGLGGNETQTRRGILELRNVMNRLRIPAEGRKLVVGTDVETALLLDEKIVLSQNTSESRAEDALANATIGRVFGFDVIVDMTIPADEAYAFVPSGFVLHTAAPLVPASVAAGATASYDGFSLRWLRDYHMDYVKDRSLVDTYVGANHVKDMYLPSKVDPINAPLDPADITEHFVRGVKLTMSGASAVPSKTGAGKDIYAETGEIKAFVPAEDPTPGSLA